jgi:hypothetical protein
VRSVSSANTGVRAEKDTPMSEPTPEQSPEDPISALAEVVAQQHEMFTEYVSAGFTRPEALKIIIAMITANAGSD